MFLLANARYCSVNDTNTPTDQWPSKRPGVPLWIHPFQEIGNIGKKPWQKALHKSVAAMCVGLPLHPDSDAKQQQKHNYATHSHGSS